MKRSRTSHLKKHQENMSSDQSFNLHKGYNLCVKTDCGDACYWGWHKVEHEVILLWTDLSQASSVCRKRIKCGRKKGCTGRYKCLTSDLNI